MRNYIFRQSLLLLIVVCLFSCGEKKPECDFKEIEPKLQSAVTMQKGSYFVYKDSISGKTDSIWAARFDLGKFCYRGSAYKYAECTMTNSSGAVIRPRALISQISMYDYSFGLVRYVWFPFHKGESAPRHSSGDSLYFYTMGDYYTNFHVGTKVYDDVYEFFNVQLSLDKTDTFYIQTFYSLKNGLVKYRQRLPDRDAEVWELERSNIIR